MSLSWLTLLITCTIKVRQKNSHLTLIKKMVNNGQTTKFLYLPREHQRSLSVQRKNCPFLFPPSKGLEFTLKVRRQLTYWSHWKTATWIHDGTWKHNGTLLTSIWNCQEKVCMHWFLQTIIKNVTGLHAHISWIHKDYIHFTYICFSLVAHTSVFLL